MFSLLTYLSMNGIMGVLRIMNVFIKKIIHGRKENMPSPERRKEIEQNVNNIISSYGLGMPGFDLTKFLIKQYDFRIGVQNFDKNTTGVLLVDDDNLIPGTNTHKFISVNKDLGVDDSYVYNLKKRFIIAHEFAHYELHKENHVQFAHRDTDKKDTPQEREADYFARCLLMPENLVSGVLNVDGIKEQSLCDKANIISRLFAVTTNKAKIRIDELGLA